jgi:hypothetical protein
LAPFVEEMADCLIELVSIVDFDEREIDSFTTQPAKRAIQAAKGESH